MTIAIVEDFYSDQLFLSECIQRHWEEHGTFPPPQIDCFTSGEQFLASMMDKQYDMVFLDYYMDGITGLQTAEKIREYDSRSLLIFVTINLSNAVDGYLVNASGYLLKPFSFENFALTFKTVLKRFSQKQAYIKIPASPQEQIVPANFIVYCDIGGHYIHLHMTDQSIIRTRMTFGEFCRLLQDYPQFLTCYRGCLVNMDHIRKVEELNFLMNSEERVPFRKKERGKLLKYYSDYLFRKVRSDIS